MAVITIPPSAFASSTPTPTTALDRLRQNAKAMRGLETAIENLSLAVTGEVASAKASKALTKARAGLLSGAATLELEPDLAQVLDEAALLQTRGQASVERTAAIGSLVATIKQTSTLPLLFAQKAALGRALVGRAVRVGLLGPAQQRTWEEVATSSALYEDTRRKLAATGAPGEALALVEEAKAAGGLVEHDSVSLDALAAARQPIETHRHRARLAWKEADDLAAFARGELPEPLGEDSFRVLHGERGAIGAYARYRAARGEAEALTLIRGKDSETIAAAQASWQGDPADFVRALAKDSAERRRDPAGYTLAAVPGLAQAYAETPEPERGPLLWSTQESLGFAEGERSPWTAAQERALADAWDALPAGHGGRNERLGFFEKHVLSLPPARRQAAISRLVRQGIVDGTEAALTRLVKHLDSGRRNPARAQASTLTSPGAQYADSGMVVSDAPISTQLTEAQDTKDQPTEKTTKNPSEDKPLPHVQKEIDALHLDQLTAERLAAVPATIAGLNALTYDNASNRVSGEVPSDEARRDVLRSLYTEWRDGKKSIDSVLPESTISAIRNLYGSYYVLDPALPNEKGLREQAFAQIVGNVELAPILNDWENSSDEQKLRAFTIAADIVRSVYQLGEFTIRTADLSGKGSSASWRPNPSGEGAPELLIDLSQELYVETDQTPYFLLDMLIHELGHAYQEKLIDDFVEGKIEPNDTLYNQVELFVLSQAFYNKVTDPLRKTPRYFHDPREGHAEAMKEVWKRYYQTL